MLCEWAKVHDCIICRDLLSPYGFIAELDGQPLLVIWAYMILDVPIIQLDGLLSAPGSSIHEVRQCWDALTKAVNTWIQEVNAKSGLNYCLIRAFVRERIGGEAVKLGWHVDQNKALCIEYVVS